MAFGVLILVGTIHSTFSNLFDAVYGNTNLIVSGKSSIGSVPEDTLAKVKRVEGVKAAAGSIGGVFRLVDEQGKAKSGRNSTLFVAGINFDGPEHDRGGDGRRHATRPAAARSSSRRPGRAERDLGLGDQVELATPAGLATLTVTGIYEFATSLDLGGYGTAAMPVAGGAGTDRQRGSLGRSHRDRRRGRRRRSGAAADRSDERQRDRSRDPGLEGRRRQRTARRPRHRPLLLLRDGALRRRLPDPQLVQHDRAAADPRDRHAAGAGRLPPPDRQPRSSARRRSSPPPRSRSGSPSDWASPTCSRK